MPALGVAQETGRVLQWLKSEGDQVNQSEPLLEIETDKTTVELEAPASGLLLNVTAKSGDEVPVGTVIAKIWAEGEASAGDDGTVGTKDDHWAPNREVADRVGTEAVTKTEGYAADHHGSPITNHGASPAISSRGRIPSSPKARRLASEQGIDLNKLTRTGAEHPVISSELKAPNAVRPSEAQESEDNRLWQIMAERMTEAWTTIPHFYLTQEIDATELIALRQTLQATSDNKITITDLLVSKVAISLHLHPWLYSQWRNGKAQQNSEINVGLAVALDQGLIVPGYS